MLKFDFECSKPYVSYIGSGIAANIGEFLKLKRGAKVCLLCGAAVKGELADEMFNSLTSFGYDAYSYVTPDGEKLKSIDNMSLFTDFLNENDFSRSDAVVNVGGGTICDFGGFVAGIYKRGIKYYNVPTTLLAAVDAAVGGKTAVNAGNVKNGWGLFYQPDAVITDCSVLRDLPDEVLKQGLSEIVKYGVIDREFGDYLINLGGFEAVKSDMEQVVFACQSIKARYVKADEFDVGERKALNFAHTYAHALESKGDYTVPHCRAVAAGIINESRLAFNLGLIGDKTLNYILKLTDIYFSKRSEASFAELIPYMLNDKKNEDGKICFSLPCENGIKITLIQREQLEKIAENIK